MEGDSLENSRNVEGSDSILSDTDIADDMLEADEFTQLSSIADADSLLNSSSLAGSEESLIDCFNTNLREMMQDLQVGFSAAMTELSNIQDEDKRLHEKLNDSKQEHEVHMKDILDVVQSLKAQCNNIQYQIDISNKNQLKLEKQMKKLKAERRESQENHIHASMFDGGDAGAGVYTSSPMLKSFIASLPLPEEMEDVEDHHSDSDESLAAVTQKSLMLTNALAQRAYDGNRRCASSTNHVQSVNGRGDNSNNSSEGSSKCEVTDCQTGTEEKRRMTSGGNPVISRVQVQRQIIAVSIVDSERNYCTTLYNLIENYSKALRESGVLSARDSSRIFPPSLSSIYEYHCIVLKRLENRMLRWKQQDIMGDIFGKFAVTKQVDIFAQYRDYIDNFASALRTIRRLNKTSERFQDALKQSQLETGGDDVSLISQLLAPVRRIPSLVLYIKKILKYTDIDHPDRFFLESSLNTFRSSLLSMNEAMERSIQMAASDCGRSKRSLETCSWSSHEEDQRLSTATKDSGIHSNCDVDSHEELPTIPYKKRERKSIRQKTSLSTDSESESNRIRELPPRPRSMLDFTRPDAEKISSLPRRSKTPTVGIYDIHEMRSRQNQRVPLKPSLSHSTPNLLDDLPYSRNSSISAKSQTKTKHKVQFKNPPEEHELRYHQQHKRVKKRSITDTLRIIFNRRKSGQSKNSNSDMSDSCCDLTSSLDEAPQPAPPHMFANSGNSESLFNLATMHEELGQNLDDDTYEDENGDPYSVV